MTVKPMEAALKFQQTLKKHLEHHKLLNILVEAPSYTNVLQQARLFQPLLQPCLFT